MVLYLHQKKGVINMFVYSLVHRKASNFSTLLSCNDIDSFVESLAGFFPLLSTDVLANVRLFCETSCAGCVYVFSCDDFFVSIK